jgi:hypothetical protein
MTRRHTGDQPAHRLRLVPDWKETTTLADLDPAEGILIERNGVPAIYTTVAELIRSAKMREDMTLAQVEAAFALPPYEPMDRGVIVPFWKLPKGR